MRFVLATIALLLSNSALADWQLGAGSGIAFRSKFIIGKAIPVSFTWNDNRYELSAIYLRDQQVEGFRIPVRPGDDARFPAHVGVAPQAMMYSASRRFNWVDRDSFKLYFGLGVAYKDTKLCKRSDDWNDRTPELDYYHPHYTGCDKLNGSHFNYALSLGFRKKVGPQYVQFTYRHFSNAGISSPNRGLDLITGELMF
jgi:hypothetical protein